MSPILRIVIFLSIAILIIGLVHYYLWLRLVRDTALTHPWKTVASISLISFGVMVLGVVVLRRLLPQDLYTMIAFPFLLWIGMMFLLFVILIGADFLRVAFWAYHRSQDVSFDPQRRIFFSRVIALSSLASLSWLTVISMRKALSLSMIRIKKERVSLARLPKVFSGFRVVQLSDMHIGPTLDKIWCEGIVARVNALKPDIVVITGDLVDGRVSDLQDDVAPLKKIKAPKGIYFCTGNHEYYSGAVEWCDELTRMGIKVLRNERVSITKDGISFDLAGVDDFSAEGHAPGHKADLKKALKGRDPSRECILIAHQPRQIEEASDHQVGLQLSGHTHGGQIWPWNYLVKIQQPYVKGLVNHKGTWLYINQGTGFWGPPMRLGTYAEISLIELDSMEKNA